MKLTRIARFTFQSITLVIGLTQLGYADPLVEYESHVAPTLNSNAPNSNKPVLLRWAEPPTFIWHYSKASSPYWLQPDEGLQLFQNAASAWQKCGVRIIYAGQTDQIPKPNKEDQNILGWGELPPHIRGFTFRSQRGGYLNQSDIMINADNADIKKDPRLLQKVITHEFGHALGLYHSKGCYDVMSSAAVCGKTDLPPPLQPTSNDLEQCKSRYESR